MKKISAALALVFSIIACKKTELPVPTEQEIATVSDGNNLNRNLTVTTLEDIPFSAVQMVFRATVSLNGGGNSLAEFGFCYSVSPNPTIADDTIHAAPVWFNDNPISARFSQRVFGLAVGTTYYIKAYGMKNNGDIYYGNEISATTLTLGLPGEGIGPVTDIDGNVYHTITLGTQVWMVENLKTTHYRDGTAIPNITDNTAWTNSTIGAYCNYDNDPSNATEYGRLYNIIAMKDPRIAPSGWHVPSSPEWGSALKYLGGSGIAGGRMKEAGFLHWLSPNTGGDNSSGFTALGSGTRFVSFGNLKSKAVFWSSTASYDLSTNVANISYLQFNYNSADPAGNSYSLGGSIGASGYSIRCVKD